MASIVDYLNSQKRDSSFSARSKLAAQYGISGYTGTASQNASLLAALQKPAASPLAGSLASGLGLTLLKPSTAFVGAKTATPTDPNSLFSVSRPDSKEYTTNAPGFQLPAAKGSLGGSTSAAMGGISGFSLNKSTPTSTTPTVGGDTGDVNAWFNASSAPVAAPTIPDAIPSDLVKRTEPLSLPEAPKDTTATYSEWLKSTGQNSSTDYGTDAYSKAYDDIGNQLMEGVGAMANKSARKAEYEKQAGLPEYQKQLNDINGQLAALNAEARSAQLDAQGKPIANSFINRQVDAIERERTVKALGLSAIASTLQGNIALANDTVERALSAEFDPIASRIEYLKTALELNKDKMTRAEKARADAQAVQLKEYELQLDAQKEEKKNVYSVMLEAAKNGADAATLNAIRNAKTAEEAISAAGASLSKSDELLSVTEAQALGVPYGTTKSQAYGISPTNTKPATAEQYKAAGFANRMGNSNSIINDLESKVLNKGILGGMASTVAGWMPNALKSDERQMMEQAQRDFVNAILRRESGAAIAPTEFQNAAIQYFPQPGDSQAVIDQKRKNREIAIQGIRNEAGTAVGGGGGIDSAFDSYMGGFNPAPSKALNGSLSQKYESSGNPGAIGYDSTGGYSYGIYQLAHNNAKTFVEQSQYAKAFEGLPFNSTAFRQKWQQVAKADPQGFAQAQEKYVADTHLGPQLGLLQSKGINVNALSPTLKEVIYSTSVQHGPKTPIVANAIAKLGPNATEQQLIRQIYVDRWNGGANFANSTPAVKKAVYNRFFGPNGELATALKMSSGNYA